MRIIAKSTLRNYVARHVDGSLQQVVRGQLDDWYSEVAKAEWKHSAELKAQIRSASIVASDRVVFNIRGNHLRLVVAVSYEFQSVFILWLGTHKEYDQIDVKTVEFEEGRYVDRSNSKRRG